MEKISEGRTAEVFAYNQNKVIKLYRNGFSAEAINYEYEVNRIVAQLGISAPRVDEIIHYNDRKGIVFERVEGSTLLRRSTQYPEELSQLMKQFANLHDSIHKYELNEKLLEETLISKQKAVLEQNIQKTTLLAEAAKAKIIDYLKSLPDGTSLCHGDYHPENVIIGEGSWVIDWMTATIGNAAGDVARTLLLFQYGTLPDEAPAYMKEAIQEMRAHMSDIYLDKYVSYSNLQHSDVDAWILPVAAARLIEWIPEEEKVLLVKVVEERL